jgi:hypothetical protein
MSFAKPAVAAVLLAIVLSACGTKTQPLAGSIPPTATTDGRGKIDDPRTAQSNHVKCLEKHHFVVTKVGVDGRPGLQIGEAPAGPTVLLEPTPGQAQGDQIEGRAQGAEVIGSALLYPNQASDKQLKAIENCLAQGVLG